MARRLVAAAGGVTLPAHVEQHYRRFSMFTDPGPYRDRIVDELPSDLREIGALVRQSIVHRTGDMTGVPWWRQPEDDLLITAPAMLAELYRRDERGFVADRAPADKLVLTCRYVSVLMASIVKAKGIPCRVRAGNAPYFDMGALGEVSTDHWINQCWDRDEARWVTVDVNRSLTVADDVDPYDVPEGRFDLPARAWLDWRAGKVDPHRFHNAGGERGAVVIAWSLFYDFHSLMGNEVIYVHVPGIVALDAFPQLTDEQLDRIDALARLMLDPDSHFDQLQEIWVTDRDFRLLGGGLL